jgi:glycosyltransferase involved in cell wall biosynthesis
MKLSVVVVNHNMCVLLNKPCLLLIRACRDIDYELIVVDDASVDKSPQMLQDEFSEAKLILNNTAVGMAKSPQPGH